MQKLIDHQEFGGMRMAFHLEGAATEGTAILEFPSIEAAKAWYSSPFYRQRWLGNKRRITDGPSKDLPAGRSYRSTRIPG